MCVDSELPDADYLLCGDWWNYYHCLLGLPVLLLQVWGLWVSVCSHRSRSWEQNKLSCLFSILFVHIVPGYGYFRLLACSPFLKPALVSAAAVHIQNHSVYFPKSYLISPTLVFCWRTKRFEAKMQRQSNKLKTKQEERWEVIWVSYTLCWKLLEIWKTKTKSPGDIWGNAAGVIMRKCATSHFCLACLCAFIPVD